MTKAGWGGLCSALAFVLADGRLGAQSISRWVRKPPVVPIAALLTWADLSHRCRWQYDVMNFLSKYTRLELAFHAKFRLSGI